MAQSWGEGPWHSVWRALRTNTTILALLLQPSDPGCTVGVIFFNNVGYPGMCGQGTIGVVATLAYLKRTEPGEHRIEAPALPNICKFQRLLPDVWE